MINNREGLGWAWVINSGLWSIQLTRVLMTASQVLDTCSMLPNPGHHLGERDRGPHWENLPLSTGPGWVPGWVPGTRTFSPLLLTTSLWRNSRSPFSEKRNREAGWETDLPKASQPAAAELGPSFLGFQSSTSPVFNPPLMFPFRTSTVPNIYIHTLKKKRVEISGF